MTAPKRDSAAWQGGEVGKAGGNQRRDHTAAAPLVELDHGEVWTTSLLIADKFGKRHADVLPAVEKLECSDDFTERNFALSDYTDVTGRRLPMYRISRDGSAFVHRRQRKTPRNAEVTAGSTAGPLPVSALALAENSR